MSANNKPIPDALLRLLKRPWRGSDDGYSSFEAVWKDDIDGGKRRRDPSFYVYHHDRMDEINNAFCGNEIESFINAGLLASLHKGTSYNNVTLVNEHAEHALSDFCGEVYDAWRKLNERLEMARRS